MHDVEQPNLRVSRLPDPYPPEMQRADESLRMPINETQRRPCVPFHRALQWRVKSDGNDQRFQGGDDMVGPDLELHTAGQQLHAD